MKETRQVMGMSATIELADKQATEANIEAIFDYFKYVDEAFSTYKKTSEISQINAGQIMPQNYSTDMQKVLAACEITKQETRGYFDIIHNEKLDPSGYVKGWAIQRATTKLLEQGLENFYLEISGDIQLMGCSSVGEPWVIGIRNPFNPSEIIKRVSLSGKGIATSGTSMQGQHIYNPLIPNTPITQVVSLTVISKDIVDSDRFATAAFAMGTQGIAFIAQIPSFEGYQIDALGVATFTPGFSQYVV